ncbi:MAG: penicillin-binding protein activator [Pseudomonadota bacterium]
MKRLTVLGLAALWLCLSAVTWAETKPNTARHKDAPVVLGQAQSIAPAAARHKSAEPHIALLLPLKSIPFGEDAEVLKQGFFAAAQHDATLNPDDLPVRVYGCEEEGRDLPALYEQAVANGAFAVVGGMTFRGFQTLAGKMKVTVPTLTLNVWKNAYVDRGVFENGNSSIITKVPADLQKKNLYFFGLSPEDEARLMAREALKQNLNSAIIILNRKPWSRAIADAFYREYVRVNAKARDRIVYTGDPSIFYRLQIPPQTAILLAVDGDEAKAIRPLLPRQTPIYATSRIFDRTANNSALEGVHFADMPWVLNGDNPTAFDYARPTASLSPEQERLYALGIDAHNLIRRVIDSLSAVEAVSENEVMQGVSGTIELLDDTFNRAALPVRFAAGGWVEFNSPPPPVDRTLPRRFRVVEQKPFKFSADETALQAKQGVEYNPLSGIPSQVNIPAAVEDQYRSTINVRP